MRGFLKIMKQRIISLLANKGYRITKYRENIVDSIVSLGHHFSFEDISNSLKAKNNLNIKSLYNNIDLFLQLNILTVFVLNNIKMYELNLNIEDHIHFIDVKTSQISSINMNCKHIQEVVIKEMEKKGIKVKYIKLEVYGTKE
jgi:Fe2+ or Zn2+ uptake regulation protein